jgi:hypothetical protein
MAYLIGNIRLFINGPQHNTAKDIHEVRGMNVVPWTVDGSRDILSHANAYSARLPRPRSAPQQPEDGPCHGQLKKSKRIRYGTHNYT